LHSLESSVLSARLSGARGHCHRIGNIYDSHLNPWFQRTAGLKKSEREELQRLFYSLRERDSLMVDTLDAAAGWLSREAAAVLDLLDKGRVDEANQRIAQARLALLPVRKVAALAMEYLREMEAEFITLAGAT
jgi:hypothetical protein